MKSLKNLKERGFGLQADTLITWATNHPLIFNNEGDNMCKSGLDPIDCKSILIYF